MHDLKIQVARPSEFLVHSALLETRVHCILPFEDYGSNRSSRLDKVALEANGCIGCYSTQGMLLGYAVACSSLLYRQGMNSNSLSTTPFTQIYLLLASAFFQA